MFRMEDSLAAQILRARGAKPPITREQVAKSSVPAIVKAQPAKQALLTLESFLAGLRWHKTEDLTAFFR